MASLTALAEVTTLAVPLLGAVKLGAGVEMSPTTTGDDGVKTGLFFKRKRKADICFDLDVRSRGVIRGNAELRTVSSREVQGHHTIQNRASARMWRSIVGIPTIVASLHIVSYTVTDY